MDTQQLHQQSPQWMQSSGVEQTFSAQSKQKSLAQQASSVMIDWRVTQDMTQFKRLNNVEQSSSSDRVSLSSEAKALQLAASQPLDEGALDLIERLEDRDREVKAHEAAHVAAGGEYVTSGASYTYQQGPNGRQYAVGGEVGIDVSPIADDPEATINKADTIVQAALSPVNPSPQDFKVADQARQMRTQAVRELAIEQAQVQQAERQDDDQIQSRSLPPENAQWVEDQQMRLAQQQAEQKPEQAQAEQERSDQQNTDQMSMAQEDESTMRSQEEENAQRLASLNELFARYAEARQAYQAIIDFFTSQYERGRQQTPLGFERFA